jgi:hypothetical protein
LVFDEQVLFDTRFVYSYQMIVEEEESHIQVVEEEESYMQVVEEEENK